MKIIERVEETRSKLIKKVIELDSYSEEEAIRMLEGIGLDNESSTKLLLAYRNANSAKNTAESFWNTALQIRTGAELPIDIAKAQQDEFDTRTLFDNINAECALQIVLNEIQPEEINDEVLNELSGYGIKEQDITNSALRVVFHYYNETKAKDIQRAEDLIKVQDYSTRIGSKMAKLEKQLQETKTENETLRNDNATLRSSFNRLQKEFGDRMAANEKYYQAARAQITSLKEMVEQLQERGVFKTIGSKLFRNKRKELPEATGEIPSTLYNTSSEEMGLKILSENNMPSIDVKNAAEVTRNNNSEER